MSESGPPEPRASRLVLDGKRLRIDDPHDVRIDVPLTSIERLHMTPAPDYALVDVYLRVAVYVGDASVEPANLPSVVTAVLRAWRVARGEDPHDADVPPPVEPPVVEPPVVEPPRPVRGPELVIAGDDWLTTEPLPDTQRLSRGELLTLDDRR